MLNTLYSCRCRLSLVWDSAKWINSQLKSVDYYIDVCLQPAPPKVVGTTWLFFLTCLFTRILKSLFGERVSTICLSSLVFLPTICSIWKEKQEITSQFAIWTSKIIWDTFIFLRYPCLDFGWPGQVMDLMCTQGQQNLKVEWWSNLGICTRFV